MKQYNYALLALFVFLLSACVKDETYNGGVFDIQVEATQITASTAVITVTFPEAKGQLANAYYYSHIYLHDNMGNKISPYGNSEDLECKPNQYKALFYNLNPDTEYRTEIEYRADVNYDKDYMVRAEYNGFSFKTAKAGDYDALGINLTCEFIASNDSYTYILFSCSSKLKFLSSPNCYASTSSDMSNPIEETVERYKSESACLAVFPLLEDGLYRFSFSSDIQYHPDGSADDKYIILENVEIYSTNNIQISAVQKTAICNTPFVGEDFSDRKSVV